MRQANTRSFTPLPSRSTVATANAPSVAKPCMLVVVREPEPSLM